MSESGEARSGSDRIGDAVTRLETAANSLAVAASERRAWRREPAWLWSDKPRSRKLYRATRNRKILGVCAGIADYYGIESWVVRCVAVTGLLFIHGVVIAAYLIAAFIMDKEPAMDTESAKFDHKRRHKRTAADAKRAPTGEYDAPANAAASERDPNPPPPPRQRLRHIHADLDEIELRLRRMETHVTSGRYELQLELAKIGKS